MISDLRATSRATPRASPADTPGVLLARRVGASSSACRGDRPAAVRVGQSSRWARRHTARCGESGGTMPKTKRSLAAVSGEKGAQRRQGSGLGGCAVRRLRCSAAEVSSMRVQQQGGGETLLWLLWLPGVESGRRGIGFGVQMPQSCVGMSGAGSGLRTLRPAAFERCLRRVRSRFEGSSN